MTRAELESRTDGFISKYLNRGIDFDGAYGFQCMDLAEQFNQEVVGAPRLGGNAIDQQSNRQPGYYDWIPNNPTNYPLKGDLPVWGQVVGQYGHIDLAEVGNVNTFDGLDQNWPLGSICHIVRHNYNGVLGFLRPKTSEPAPPPEPTTTTTTTTTTTETTTTTTQSSTTTSETSTTTLPMQTTTENLSWLTRLLRALQSILAWIIK